MNMFDKMTAKGKAQFWTIVAIQIAWVAIVIKGYFTDPNNYIGTVLTGAGWVVKQVMFSAQAEHQGIFFFMMLMFPLIFFIFPALAYKKFKEHRSARHANP